MATEVELEQVLTRYTRLHRSSSVFLGQQEMPMEESVVVPAPASAAPSSSVDDVLARLKALYSTTKK